MNYSNLNKFVQQAPENLIRTFSDEISSVEGLLRFNIGEPDFATPEIVKNAAKASIDADQSFYTHSRGLVELREAIRAYLQRKYDLTYRVEDQIIVTSGATEALYLALMGIVNPGEKVVIVEPNYVIYNSHIALTGSIPVSIDVSDTQFKLTPQQLDRVLNEHPTTKAIIFNHPTNPTGVTYTGDEIEALSKVITKHNLYVISDEVYSEFTYTHHHVSMAQFIPERTLLVNGTSKSHAMTGWRSAFLAGPAELLNVIYPLHQAVVTAPTTQVQYASIVAYNDGDEAITAMYESYRERRDFIYQGLNKLGFESLYPDAAFYLFTKVPDWYDGDDYAFCLDLAHQDKIAVTPGQIFGAAGKGYFRTSYVSSLENLAEYLKRIESFRKNYTN